MMARPHRDANPKIDGRMSVEIDIAIAGGDWPPTDNLSAMLKAAVDATVKQLGFADKTSELSVLLTGDEEIRSINAQWRSMDKPTNVLSFPAVQLIPGDSPGPLLGDIIMAQETIVREAAIDGKTFDAHFSHLAVHGLLHLLGYDHENDEDAEVMEGLERQILAKLGIADPYFVPDTGEE